MALIYYGGGYHNMPLLARLLLSAAVVVGVTAFTCATSGAGPEKEDGAKGELLCRPFVLNLLVARK